MLLMLLLLARSLRKEVSDIPPSATRRGVRGGPHHLAAQATQQGFRSGPHRSRGISRRPPQGLAHSCHRQPRANLATAASQARQSANPTINDSTPECFSKPHDRRRTQGGVVAAIQFQKQPRQMLREDTAHEETNLLIFFNKLRKLA